MKTPRSSVIVLCAAVVALSTYLWLANRHDTPPPTENSGQSVPRSASVDAGDAVRIAPTELSQPRAPVSLDLDQQPTPKPEATKLEPGSPPLSEADTKLVNHISAFLRIRKHRIEALLRVRPDVAAEVHAVYGQMTADRALARSRLDARMNEIAQKRLASGQFEVIPSSAPWPPELPGEVHHRSSLRDKETQQNITRIVRIRAGEDAEFDLLRTDFETSVSGAKSVIEHMLALHKIP
jgi:hypothetical protein